MLSGACQKRTLLMVASAATAAAGNAAPSTQNRAAVSPALIFDRVWQVSALDMAQTSEATFSL